MVARCLNLLVEGKILDQMILRILLLICYGATLYATDNHDHAEYYARAMYNISRSIYVEHGSHQQKVPKVHLIRVPKASSSSMSQVARRIAGCTPVGPCCKWPGDPPGSCPSKALFQCQLEGRVIGCTHHHPFYSVLLNPLIPSLTMMRDPVSRSLSAFFYSGIHHNSDCTNRVFHGMSTMNPTHLALRTNSTTMGLMKCFQGYASASSWQNVFTKLLNGKYAYAPVRAMADTIVSTSSLELAQRNIDKLFFVGVTELWELSLLVLFAKLPTVPPDLEEFLLERGNTGGASVLPQKQVAGGKRTPRVIDTSTITVTLLTYRVTVSRRHSLQ
mmetsp:Transcript_26067/g.43415  ORF Transcript_26067/g.43415 Transcript_26067/m.43415 type:complete len:331 (-) Transcript_26067:1332-2324(-)